MKNKIMRLIKQKAIPDFIGYQIKEAIEEGKYEVILKEKIDNIQNYYEFKKIMRENQFVVIDNYSTGKIIIAW